MIFNSNQEEEPSPMAAKICCIFNYPPHYRAPIFTLMDQKLECDFYFGDNVESPIKKMAFNELSGFKKTLKNIPIKGTGFKWQKGVWTLVFKPYRYYIITGDPAYISHWIFLILTKFTRKKVIAWTHGLKKPVETNAEKLHKVFYRLCDILLVYGDYSRNIMIKEGFSGSKIIPIYNSLDHNQQQKVRKNLITTNIYTNYFKNQCPTIIYIGRLQISKKLDQLVSAIKYLKERNVLCNLIFVGKEIEETPLKMLVENYGIGNQVWFYGPTYEENEIGELLFNADVCVSPGPVGLTAIHALTYGCPVISNDDFHNQMPEHEAIIPGVTGEFFQNDNIEDLAQTIEKWIGLTSVKRLDIRREAYKTVDQIWNPRYQLGILKKILNQSR